MTLTVSPCRVLCDWAPSDLPATAGTRLFACSGCGSQWTPAERWTPRQADGSVPGAVRAARLSAAASGGADTAGS